MLPFTFCDLFQPNKNIHSHFTRHSDNYHIYHFNTTINKKSFVFSGIQLWNNLDPLLKNISTVPLFTKKLKIVLVNKYQ